MPDETVLRTEINHGADVEQNNSKDTGVQHECAFNNVRHYHCMRNILADILHVLPEGVLTYKAVSNFNQLVLVDKLIDFDTFNFYLTKF